MPDNERHLSFPTTHWTMVQCIQAEDPEMAAAALGAICENYWYPVYAYLRRSGRSSADAEDLTQTLFQKIVADGALREACRERGKLRSFLISMIGRVISRQQRRDHTGKRGGGQTLFSLDELDADNRYLHEPADLSDPERLYDRAWAMQLLESVRQALRASFVRINRLGDYELLEPYLGWEDTPAPYAQLGGSLGSNGSAARVLVHRLRKKFRELLEAEILKTVTHPDDLATELAWLKEVVRGGT